MLHVFVETNWVFDFAAPAHCKDPAAVELMERSKRGKLKLHLPAPCLTEARHAMPRRYDPKAEAQGTRGFLSWAGISGGLAQEHVQAIYRAVDQFEKSVPTELKRLPQTLAALKSTQNLDVFPVNEPALTRAAELAYSDLWLEPFVQAILAAVLSRAHELWDLGERDLCFCELDKDLQPWDKHRNRKPQLADLYDQARVWVYGDFDLTTPKRPGGWPENVPDRPPEK
jgi:hypothetical protein